MAAASSSSPASLSLSLDSLLSSTASHHSPPSSLPFPSTLKPKRRPRPKIKLQVGPPHSQSQTTTITSNSNTFIDPISLHRLHTLNNFSSTHRFPNGGGSLHIRPMAPHEVDLAVSLLADSFSDSLFVPGGYVRLLEFLIRQYVSERRNLLPHAVMLVGFYREEEEKEEEGEDNEGGGGAQLVCTAEVSFDARGANAAPPTPLPPTNCPYICNMTVKKSFRRRGIGRQLLKVCEELISEMKTIRKVYLHCRVIDTVPFRMYKKAGYSVVSRDSILVWFTLQRRKYLMSKELPPLPLQRASNSEEVAGLEEPTAS